jgi:hypothetical protein
MHTSFSLRMTHTPDPKSLSPEEQKEVQRALRMGTFGKIDRTEQYAGLDRAKPEQLLKAVNKANNGIRALQVEKDRIYRTIFNLRLRNSIVVAAVTGLLSNAPAIYRWLHSLFR